MEKMLSWLQRKEQTHGPIVNWAAALVFLLAAAFILALLFAVVGFAMWISPYLAAGVTIGIVGFVIYKQY
jgi:uncharacterized protein YqfA (UPF0365 family)